MNVSELARKLKINSNELLEILPGFGFDIGKRAIKIDDKVARKILDIGEEIRAKLASQKKVLAEESLIMASPQIVSVPLEIKIPPVITVRDFAKVTGKPINEVIKELMKNGVLASLNEKIDYDTASIIADEFGIKLSLSAEETNTEQVGEKIKQILEKEKKSDLVLRAPVVVVMGHVDHGKTRLLDTIRKTNVIAGEAGGITQHIGAYQVIKKNQLITFIDTPGHEAFTAMRSRGARVADIAILVVAANDSVKPQTAEAIKIIQQAKIPMIVAINKIDLPEADVEKVKKDLAALNLLPEDWGGQTICRLISAKENKGIDELLETILLVSEMEKDKIVANPHTEAVGTVVEAHIDRGEGPVATVLIQNGTMKVGDNLCIDELYYGKARALKNYLNQDISEAGPSVPVKIIGLKITPKVGDIIEVTCNLERKHKKIKAQGALQTESVFSKSLRGNEDKKDEGIKKLKLLIKADVLGSLEVIIESIEKIESKEVKIEIVSRGLGPINESDIDLASASDAMIIGFHVKASPQAEDFAREKNIEIRYYNVIYKLLEEIREKLSELLTPEIISKEVGKVEVLAVFKTESKEMILGVKVLAGIIRKNFKATIFRGKEIIASGEITEVQIGKEKVTDAVEGQECGIKFLGKPLVKVGDILYLSQEEQIIKNI